LILLEALHLVSDLYSKIETNKIVEPANAQLFEQVKQRAGAEK
jgi:hypothetical protein